MTRAEHTTLSVATVPLLWYSGQPLGRVCSVFGFSNGQSIVTEMMSWYERFTTVSEVVMVI